MIIDTISDLHGHYLDLPGGDLLILAGDLTRNDEDCNWMNFNDWLSKQKYKSKIFISGNHDNHCFESYEISQKYNGTVEPFGVAKCDYLCDTFIEYKGLKIWGMPWTPSFPNQNPAAMAFTMPWYKMHEKTSLIPDHVDILITHGPGYGVLDETQGPKGTNAGCVELRKRIASVKPKLHIFGHIHENGGKQMQFGSTLCCNVSYVNEDYEPVNPVTRIEYKRGKFNVLKGLEK